MIRPSTEAGKDFPQQHWLSMLQNFSNVKGLDAIRQYCPARLKEEQFHLIKWEDDDVRSGRELESHYLLWSPSQDHHRGTLIMSTNTTDPHPPDHPSLEAADDDDDQEVEEIVDTFFNVECFDKDHSNLMQLRVPDQGQGPATWSHHCSQDTYDYFSILPSNYLQVDNDNFGGSIVAGDAPNFLPDDDDDEVDLSGVLLTSSCSFDDHNHDLGGHITHSGGGVSVPVQLPHDQRLQLVHTLLGCAEAVGCRDTQLADSILTQIWPSVSPWGDSLQRVSYCFAKGLKVRLSLLQNPLNANGTLFTHNTINNSNCTARNSFLETAIGTSSSSVMMVSKEDDENKMEAFHLLLQTTPYVSFGFMAANDAICQATKGKDFLHILDLGSRHHLQWPSLIRNLSTRNDGPPKLVRITSIMEDQEAFNNEFHQGLHAIVHKASPSLGVPVQCHIITRPLTPSLLTKENLDLREGEELIVNCIMYLHKFVKESGGSLKAFLLAIKRLNPILLTVVEQDANHNGPFFLGRFLESLHYYSAIFDSLEAMLPRDSVQRMKIEKHYYAEEILNIIASEGSDRIERHQRMDQWRRQLGRAGFQIVGFKSMSQARMMLSVYGSDDYTLAIEKGCLLLGWKGRPIMFTSAWQVGASQF